MGKIVAIGGGEIGRYEQPVETTGIDEEIIRLSGKANPKLLFIPTATNDSETYIEAIRRHFGETLGCTVDILSLVKERPGPEEIRDKIFNTDIIYVGGGNTLRMMKRWRRLGVDRLLLQAYQKNIVMSGLSAGAICWFRYGSSDSRKFTNPGAGLIKVKGLNIIDALFCPHYDIEEDRRPHFRELMKRTPGVGIAVDNCCAIEITENRYRIITSQNGAGAYKVYWRRGEFYEKRIEQKEESSPINELLSK